MNIAVHSHFFYPSVGGVEMMSEGLAREWHEQGHGVRVLTDTPLEGRDELENLVVTRQPTSREHFDAAQWADVFVRSGHSLRSLPWPLLAGTPLVTVHHRPIRARGRGAVYSVLERWTTYVGHNVAVSGPVQETIPGATTRIPNTFRSVFDQIPPDEQLRWDEDGRDGILFVGRLVSRKGGDVALQALADLRERGRAQDLTICGDGSEREALERQARRRGIEAAVTFEGWTDPSRLAELYRQAEVAVVPSREEPFGIVALEAIASGCPVVASEVGGLPEAVGNCGLLVEPDCPTALANGIEAVLQPEVRARLRCAMPEHVAQHRIDRIAEEYLSVLESVAGDTVK